VREVTEDLIDASAADIEGVLRGVTR